MPYLEDTSGYMCDKYIYIRNINFRIYFSVPRSDIHPRYAYPHMSYTHHRIQSKYVVAIPFIKRTFFSDCELFDQFGADRFLRKNVETPYSFFFFRVSSLKVTIVSINYIRDREKREDTQDCKRISVPIELRSQNLKRK